MPENDGCDGALPIDLASGSARLSLLDLGGASDSPSTCTARPDVFYRFTLAERSLVWAWIEHGSRYGTAVGLHPSCSAGAIGCLDLFAVDPSSAGEATAVLEAGAHVLSVEGGDRRARTTVMVHAIAIGEAEPFQLTFGPSGILEAETFVGTTVGASHAPASCAPGPDAAFWFRVLPDELPGSDAYEASACGSGAFDSALSLVRSDGAASICADADECGLHGTLRFTLSRLLDPGGLYAIFVDGVGAADAGDYTLAIRSVP